ncbi:MAG: sigma-54 dependent transcriptional regulator [Armatimonadota bacterium]|nr:sigma-54 dependent transcriptional regulator [Armatimonadota bacterium]
MSRHSRILLADDAAQSSQALRALLEKDGHQVQVIPDGEQARQLLQSNGVDLLIADLVVPSLDGFGLLRAAHEAQPDMPVILVSEYGTIETAVEALRQGAYYYFQKPLDMDAVRATVSEALSNSRTPRRAKSAAPRRPPDVSDRDNLGIVGKGLWLDQVFEPLRRVAPTRATVLLAGESGTGKELFARAIHRMSGRRGPFVAVSCAALSRDLLESELFGHEKGAFTGADRQKPGRFERAEGGTLLLDEIGDIPLDLQVKLLRVLQEREFERVGGTEALTADVRIVAAINRDLAAAVQERTFREDLYYRLKVIEITLPPLRERPDDIEPLACHFVQTYAAVNGKPVSRLTPAALQLLRRYPWPGNVRELENAIEHAVVLAEPGAEEVDPSLLPAAVRDRMPTLFPTATWINQTPSRSLAQPLHGMDERERIHSLADALQRAGGNATSAARLLGVSPRSVRYYADKYGLPRRSPARRGQ